MKLTEYFAQLLVDTVNLNQSRLDNLDSRVDSITSALKGASVLDGRVIDTVPQGSWAHRTIIRPATGIQFDADFLVQIDEDLDWNDNPRQYSNAVWKALSAHGTYGSMSEKKDRCVRVRYANECHIDVVAYVVQSDGRQVIVNRSTNEFENTNPVGFTEWIQEKDRLTGGDLRKVLRLLKYLRDYRNAFSIKSVLLTTVVGNVVDTWRTYDPDYYKDVPTTLVHLVQDLDQWLQAHPWKPSICDPSCPATSFDHRWTEEHYLRFRDKIHDLSPKITDAYNTAGIAASVTAWQRVFGASFPSTLRSATVVPNAQSLTKSFIPPPDRAPKERFIEEMYPVSETNHVEITCEVTEPQYANRTARRRALRSRNGRVPKNRKLLFEVVSTNVPAPFSTFWKVRNYGSEARSRGALRGEIYADGGNRQRTETTSYIGHHYVECYIVKDGVCVARAREPVIIT